MAKGKDQLFEYAIVYNPKSKKKESKIIKCDKLLAKDQALASKQVLFTIPEKYRNNLEEIDIYVRSFI